MKTRKTISTLTVAVLIAGFTSCGTKQETKDQTEMHEKEMPMHEDMDHSGHDMAGSGSTNMQSNLSDEQAEKILNAYLQLKDALVKTDGAAASSAAANLVAVIGKDADDLAGNIRQSAQQVASTSGIEEQRKHFSTLSDHVYAMVKATDATDAKLYRQHCPMAMNNNGAYWLSSNEEIKNPYFGDKMLKCGSVKETIQ